MAVVRDDRIKELEDTLRESVKITAEREMLIADQESLLNKAQEQVSLIILSDLDNYMGKTWGKYTMKMVTAIYL